LLVTGMSLLVFAGASQFAMVQLFSDQAPTAIVVASVLFINLRHLLMATSLRAELRRLPIGGRLFAAFFLTDESFAMATGHFRRGGRSLAYYFTFAISPRFATSTVIMCADCHRNARRSPRAGRCSSPS